MPFAFAFDFPSFFFPVDEGGDTSTLAEVEKVKVEDGKEEANELALLNEVEGEALGGEKAKDENI